MRYFAKNNTLENALTAFELRASRRHSLKNPYPTDRLKDAVHFDLPIPSGKALVYNDSDSEEEGYPPVSSTGFPRGGSELPNSQKR